MGGAGVVAFAFASGFASLFLVVVFFDAIQVLLTRVRAVQEQARCPEMCAFGTLPNPMRHREFVGPAPALPRDGLPESHRSVIPRAMTRARAD